MHNQNNKPKVICLGTNAFNKSLDEIKNFLNFNLIFCNNLSDKVLLIDSDIIIIDANLLNNVETIKLINEVKNKIKLLINNSKVFKAIKYDDLIERPLVFTDLNKRLTELYSKKKFLQNSSIKIKSYTLDKNEKKLKSNNLFVILTDKEIDLLVILHLENKPMTKKNLLIKVWSYAVGADTHTVETHIYRLRKKIFNKFKDNNFIISNDDGYLI